MPLALPTPIGDLISSVPYNAVCHLSTRRRNFLVTGSYFGSGFLVGPRHVATAAHNVHSERFSRLKSLAVALGVEGRREAWSLKGAVNRIHVARGYKFTRRDKFARDYALIDLGEEAPVVGMSLADPDMPLRVGDPVRLGGYPGEQFDGRTQMSAAGRVTHVDGPLIRYNIDTQTGNSGGPVWVERDGASLVVAVHIGEGLGRRLDVEAQRDFSQWRL